MSASELNTTRKIGPASAGLLMTPDEFDAITDYDDRYRYELIRGVLVVNPIPSEAEAIRTDSRTRNWATTLILYTVQYTILDTGTLATETGTVGRHCTKEILSGP